MGNKIMNYYTVPIVRFFVEDEGGLNFEADDDSSFDETDDLLNRLRKQNPDENYRMVAIVDA